MTPSTVVSDIAHERLAGKQAGVQAFYGETARTRGTDDGPRPNLPKAGTVESTETLLSPEKVDAVRNANTKAQLRSNFWFDVSRVAFWATTSLIMASVGALAGASFMAGAAAIYPIIGAVISATILVASSQYSKRLVTERWFDVQDFQQQRQAALIGKSVEHAMETQPGGHQAVQNWRERVALSAAEAPEQQR